MGREGCDQRPMMISPHWQGFRGPQVLHNATGGLRGISSNDVGRDLGGLVVGVGWGRSSDGMQHCHVLVLDHSCSVLPSLHDRLLYDDGGSCGLSWHSVGTGDGDRHSTRRHTVQVIRK